jgi:hypothetical protein
MNESKGGNLAACADREIEAEPTSYDHDRMNPLRAAPARSEVSKLYSDKPICSWLPLKD